MRKALSVAIVAAASVIVPVAPAAPQTGPVLEITPAVLDVGTAPVGRFGDARATATLTNTGDARLEFLESVYEFPISPEFSPDHRPGATCPRNLDPGESCELDVSFFPYRAGRRSGALRLISNSSIGRVTTLPIVGTGTVGYYLVHESGAMSAYGDAPRLSLPARAGAPAIGGAMAWDAKGIWAAFADGAVHATRSTDFFGSLYGRRLDRPIVGMARPSFFLQHWHPYGFGYWLVASDGGVFAFGRAGFLGSTGARPLRAPVVGIAPSTIGPGYWLVAADGGVFAYGISRFWGSMGGRALAQPIVGMATTTTGRGYWLVARDGGVFAFGDARFYGSTGGMRLDSPIVGIAPASSGDGYWLAAADGGVFAFGPGARFVGSAARSGSGGYTGIVAANPPNFFVAQDELPVPPDD
jgi:hypothetical protein